MHTAQGGCSKQVIHKYITWHLIRGAKNNNMVSLISANTAQLKLVYQEKLYGLHVFEAGFLNEIHTMPNICKEIRGSGEY